MTERLPLIIDSGKTKQMPSGDVVPVAAGGTGAVDEAGARTNLDVYSTGEVDAAVAVISGNGTGVPANGVVSGLGVSYTGTDLTWAMTAGSANIDGTLVTAIAQTVALDAADATDPRIDALYIDDTGTFGKITGTPATAPSTPTVDPTTQLYLAYALVPATATDLTSNITTEEIYTEGVEWTGTASGSGVTIDSTNNPKTGTKCVEFTAVSANAYAKFVDGSPSTFDGTSSLLISIRSQASWNSKRSLNLQWYDASGTALGSPVVIKEGSFGFSSSNTSSYQDFVIPESLFAVTTGTTRGELRATVKGNGGTMGFYLDDIKVQTIASGTGGTGTTSGITPEQADARYLKLAGGTLTGDLTVPAEVYGAGWNGSNEVPTKNDVYDKIETVVAAGATRDSLGLDTDDSPQFLALNIGDAADTTLARASAGNLSVEGNLIYRAGGTDVPVTDGGTGASDAATARTNLAALGECSDSEGWTGSSTSTGVSPRRLFTLAAPQTLTSASNATAVDMATGINFNLTLDEDSAISNPTNAKAGQSGRIRVTDDGTGGWDLTWGANWNFVGSDPSPITTVASEVHVFAYFVNTTSDIEVSYLGALV